MTPESALFPLIAITLQLYPLLKVSLTHSAGAILMRKIPHPGNDFFSFMLRESTSMSDPNATISIFLVLPGSHFRPVT